MPYVELQGGLHESVYEASDLHFTFKSNVENNTIIVILLLFCQYSCMDLGAVTLSVHITILFRQSILYSLTDFVVIQSFIWVFFHKTRFEIFVENKCAKMLANITTHRFCILSKWFNIFFCSLKSFSRWHSSLLESLFILFLILCYSCY